MRIIKWRVLRDFFGKHPAAESGLCRWFEVTRKARWQNPADVRDTFNRTDMVTVDSGRTAAVFDVSGGNYRVIAAIHYDKQRVYTLFVLTHEEYETNRWRKEL